MMKNKQEKHKNITLLARSGFIVSKQSNQSQHKTLVLQEKIIYLSMIKYISIIN